MKQAALFLSILLMVPVALKAQLPDAAQVMPADSGRQYNFVREALPAAPKSLSGAPLSRVAFSVAGSPLGLRLMAATNLNRYLNVRVAGARFNYAETNLSVNDFNVTGRLNLASAGVSLDVYPFPNHGLRFSPGVLFYNDNGISGNFSVHGGTSFTLNDDTYYASSTNPVRGHGALAMNTQNPAFTITSGWGNMVRSRGRFSFPFEIGVALVGQPSMYLTLDSGQVCDASGLDCENVASDPNLKKDLQTQVAKYRKDLEPLKTYPIVSGGIAYSFRIR